MKTKTTDTALKARCEAVYNLHTNQLDKLLRWFSPDFYNTDKTGHRYDAYLFGAIAMTTGRKATGQDIEPEALRRYEGEAAAAATIEEARALAERIAEDLTPKGREGFTGRAEDIGR